MTVSAERIERALLKVAAMLENNSAVAPVFERLERELAVARARARARERGESEVQRRARALRAQRATGTRRSRTWASDAPAP